MIGSYHRIVIAPLPKRKFTPIGEIGSGGSNAHLSEKFEILKCDRKVGEWVSVKKHEQGFELYKKSKGKVSNADIAKHLGVSDSTVRKWKSRYKWNEKLGIKKTVTPSKKKSVTKNIRQEEHERITNALAEAGIYSLALEPLIDIYLDAYERYIETEKQDDKLRKELARLLGQLGLDGRNKDLIKQNGRLLEKQKEEDEKKEEDPQNNKLLLFRQRVSK